MREEDADALLGEIKKVAGDKPIRFVVNTHAHADHTGGNLKIAEAGSQLVAGNFSRARRGGEERLHRRARKRAQRR